MTDREGSNPRMLTERGRHKAKRLAGIHPDRRTNKRPDGDNDDDGQKDFLERRWCPATYLEAVDLPEAGSHVDPEKNCLNRGALSPWVQ